MPPMPMTSVACREHDELLLVALSRARRGETLAAIAASLGVSADSLRMATRRVFAADQAESGEITPAEIAAHYPWRRR